MKGSTALHWIVTGLMAAFMLSTAIPDIAQIAQAVSIMQHLGYPLYLLPFLGTAKSLAVATVVVPAPSRLKEWAFAGLTIDLVGALYSHLSSGDGPGNWAPAVIGMLLVGGSYLSYRVRLRANDTDHRYLSQREPTAA